MEILQQQRFMWCLDNGHGKLQNGKRSPVFPDGRQFLEYEFNRDIVERIMKRLDELCIVYFDVVPDVHQVGSFLLGRVARANRKDSIHPKIYLSIHANAARKAWSSPTGVETWHHKNSRKGKALAEIFQRHLVEQTGWKDRGLKTTAQKSLYVLDKTAMPAVLTESGFFTNLQQAQDLMKDEVRQRIAEAHVRAIYEIERDGLPNIG